MAGNSRRRSTNVLIGRWRIVGMDLWDQEDVDLVAPGFIEFGKDNAGSFGFIAVQGGIDWRDAPRGGRPGVEFTWEGFDEGDGGSPRERRLGRARATVGDQWPDGSGI
jgi:hypothetical protein